MRRRKVCTVEVSTVEVEVSTVGPYFTTHFTAGSCGTELMRRSKVPIATSTPRHGKGQEWSSRKLLTEMSFGAGVVNPLFEQ